MPEVDVDPIDQEAEQGAVPVVDHEHPTFRGGAGHQVRVGEFAPAVEVEPGFGKTDQSEALGDLMTVERPDLEFVHHRNFGFPSTMPARPRKVSVALTYIKASSAERGLFSSEPCRGGRSSK